MYFLPHSTSLSEFVLYVCRSRRYAYGVALLTLGQVSRWLRGGIFLLTAHCGYSCCAEQASFIPGPGISPIAILYMSVGVAPMNGVAPLSPRLQPVAALWCASRARLRLVGVHSPALSVPLSY